MVIKNVSRVVVHIAVAVLTLGLVPGCIKYHRTLPTEFPQGEKKKDYSLVTAAYVKSAKVYDQFSTQAIFDALWLSDDVRVAYANMYCSKRGKSADDTEAFMTRQREENKHWVMLYVLADVRDRQKTSLSDKNAPWTFYLKMGDYMASPISVKEVELEPEYQALFGKQYNMFKTAYAVKFPVREETEKTEEKSSAVHLIIESVNKSVTLTWPADIRLDAKKKVVHNEDFYWG